MNKILSILVAIIALTVMAPGHAEDKINDKELSCLAHNIYYEAASEPEEGKVAVGLVTINRSNSGNFPTTICGVVNQRTNFSVPKKVTKIHTVTEGVVFKKTRQVRETMTVWTSRAICQFSWRCEHAHKIRSNDTRWDDSVAVAQELLAGGYEEYRDKYRDALYFHERHIHPAWAKQKVKIDRVGGHIFYAEQTHELTIATN
jgi:spore germination cell wall hydrolase CwlJ-like protein